MGDLVVSSSRPNGTVWPLRLLPSVAADVFGSGGADCDWTVVEEATAQVFRTIQPTFCSERERGLVVSYVQRLLGGSLGCQVSAYGSVPLKTYLPDGDIDLTVLCNPHAEDALISDIFDVLKKEALIKDAEFEVKDVHLISAEVKLVRCLIQNIIVDISCNQLGGLCTLCFLEQIDRLVDKDHLFKRSIILIKAWCYYESRILGATHGLISTYALEILVLYIFHVYHSSLKGPSSVLYRFLDYFSKFDWETYCVSLLGPVCKSSLPDIVAQPPEAGRDGLLLSKQFLTNSASMFTVPSRELGKQPRPFQQKFINIIDPLKDNNNLGRSVNRGNFYRIRSALKFGACKLGEILALPTESMRKELKNFFANTLARHGGGLQARSQSSDPSCSSSFRSSDVDSSVGVKSPRIDNEGTSDSSSQASDASSHRDQYELLNSLSAKEVGVDKCREPTANFTNVSNSPRPCARYGDMTATHLAASEPKSSKRVSSKHHSWNLIDHNEESEHLTPFSDLTGDYESHLKSLLYGQSFHGNAIFLPMFYNLPVWEVLCRTVDVGQDLFLQMNTNGAMWGQPRRHVRGTGTYIPRMNLGSWRGGRVARRGRNHTQGRSSRLQSCHHDRGLALGMIQVQPNVTEQIYHRAELLEPRLSTAYPSPPSNSSSLSEQSGGLEFSSSEHQQEEKDEADERVSDDSLASEANLKAPATPVPEQELVDTKESLERVAEQPYQLKDEADFPPLVVRIPIRRSVSA